MKYLPQPIPAILFVAVCEISGFLVGMATLQSVTTWYVNLAKPPLNPPNWIFGPVWAFLYLTLGLSAGYLYQECREPKKSIRFPLFLFFAQLLLNLLWSYLFFGRHSPLYALIDIIFLIVLVVATTVSFYKENKIAGIILLPYLLWITFAMYLNLGVYLLNE